MNRNVLHSSLSVALLLLTLPAVQAQFNYNDNGDGTATITGYTGFGGAVTIPDTIDGLRVTSIGNFAFNGCQSLTSVTIPNSATSIGYLAFGGCTSLTEITVDALNSVYSSVDGVLFNKTQTTLIQYPARKAGTSYTISDSVTTIGNYAFDRCQSLTSVTIPNSVTTIGAWSFEFCSSLTSVTIPNSVTSIGWWAFVYCTSLTEITVDALNSVYGSVDGVLFDKSQSTLIEYPGGKTGTYVIPDSVAIIGGGAFSDCTSLTSVTIPRSVANIGDYAFAYCFSLTGLYFPANPPSLGGSEVFCFDYNATVYYLPGTTGWGTTFGGLPAVLLAAPNVTCSVQQPVLWPPDQKLDNVGLAVTAAENSSSPLPVTIQVFCNQNVGTVASIDADTLRLRAERVGNAKYGRVYLIVAKAADSFGSVGFASCTVVVPHDASPRSTSAVNTLAADAKTFCDSQNGAPPPDYFLIANGSMQ